MIYLFDRIEKILKRLKGMKRIFLFLDYDGTLTPIVSHPREAYLSGEMRGLLSTLKKNPRILLGIISGRYLMDIRKRVGLKGIYYVGNHGLEIFEPKYGTKRLVSKEIIRELEGIRDRLNNRLREMKGVVIEDKGCILAIHYRHADQREVPSLLMILKQEIQNSFAPLYLGFGKYVFEVRPNDSVNKGIAVLNILDQINREEGVPFYIGDDQTDEDVFRILRGKGFTIFVGNPGLSSARYYVKDPSEVFHFLKAIKEEFA